ncbi:diguanylate cyclase [Acidobacteriota bacterium]
MMTTTDFDQEKILVVDDEETIRTLLENFLADEGYEIDTAASGQEALEFLNTNNYNLVLTDIRMPAPSGIELLKIIKERTPATEVIIFTGHSTEELAIKAVKLGAFDYLKKPVDDIAMITQLINRVLQKQRLMRENQMLLDSLSHKNEELNQANQRLREIAITDPLTGLFNRRYFLSRLSEEFERARRYTEPFGVAMIDIDHFKQINDNHGHQVGDEVLKEVASKIRGIVRYCDLLGRYGGEEFFLLLTNTDLEGSRATAERIRTAVEKHNFKTNTATFRVTISIGVAESAVARI